MFVLYLSNEKLDAQTTAMHFGHPIDCESQAINIAVKDIVWRTNNVVSKFGSCSSDVRMFFFLTHCSSCYGSSL